MDQGRGSKQGERRVWSASYRRAVLGVASAVIGTTMAGAVRAEPSPTHCVAVRASAFDLTHADMPALRGQSLYVDPSSAARRQVDAWRKSRPADAALLEREVASQPTAVWLGDWSKDVTGDVSRVVSAAAKTNALPVLVAYNIPLRDCGSHSSGGSKNAETYKSWIRAFAKGLTRGGAVVVLEPDALASTKCLTGAQKTERFSLIKYAVEVLKAENAFVYIDAGHANWLPAGDMAERLQEAGVALADGFSLNVSNFISNAANIRFGDDVSRRTGGKHYVIDSSRNGVGATGDAEWCNPSGRALGTKPTTQTGHAKLDAYLWVKKPGESDGACNGGPKAGQFWADYALSMAKRSGTAVASAG